MSDCFENAKRKGNAMSRGCRRRLIIRQLGRNLLDRWPRRARWIQNISKPILILAKGGRTGTWQRSKAPLPCERKTSAELWKHSREERLRGDRQKFVFMQHAAMLTLNPENTVLKRSQPSNKASLLAGKPVLNSRPRKKQKRLEGDQSRCEFSKR